SWTKIYDSIISHSNGLAVWQATAAADLPITSLTPWGGGSISASDIVKFGVGGGGGFTDYYVLVIPGKYASTLAYAGNSGSSAFASVTVGSDTISVNLTVGGGWELFGLVLSPSNSIQNALTIGFLRTSGTPDPNFLAFGGQGAGARIVLPGASTTLYD